MRTAGLLSAPVGEWRGLRAFRRLRVSPPQMYEKQVANSLVLQRLCGFSLIDSIPRGMMTGRRV